VGLPVTVDGVYGRRRHGFSGALVFSAVLLVLLGHVVLDTLGNDGGIEPTLVILDIVTVVMLVLAAVSVAAIVVAVKHLLEIRNPSG
jgi:hypothetical protein